MAFPLSLRGLTSEDADINELNRGLRIGEILDKQNNTNNINKILTTSCLCVHNEENIMIVGSRPDNSENNATNNGLLSIYNMTKNDQKESDINDNNDILFNFQHDILPYPIQKKNHHLFILC
eukprot:902198_1